MHICRVKATKHIIEAQGNPDVGTLLRNAVAAGYQADAIEEIEISEEAFAILTAPSPLELSKQAAIVELAQLDMQSIRALRAFARGKAVKSDADKLAALDARAAELRGIINA